MECKRCGLPPLLSHFPDQLKLGKNAFLSEEPQGDSQGRLDSVAAGAGTNTVSVAFFPREPWAIRMEKRTATNAVSWSERQRTLPFCPANRRCAA